QAFEGIEIKIQKIEEDLAKNEEVISDIKKWVGALAEADSSALSNLVLKAQAQSNLAELVKKGGGVGDGAGQVVETQVEGQGREEEKPREMYEVVPGQNVPVSGSMCQWTSAQGTSSDIDMHKLFDALPFDNPDGGVWKQGWPVTYDANQWKEQKLKIFVVPHTHCDPGWIKTFTDYYKQQTRNIFENMLPQLEKDPRRKFIYAEISYFSLWWDEIDAMKRDRVKKLVDAGRLEIVTGGWVMPDEANTHYFAMLDQLIEGHQWLNGTLGVKPKSGWSIDPFGYSSTMAYLLKRTGFDNMLIQRVHYSIKKELAKQRALEFRWRQQWDQEKTTDMFCHMMPFYSYDIPHTCGPDPKVCCQFDFRRLPGSKYNCPWKVPPVAINDGNVATRAQMLLDQYRKKAQLYKTNVLLAPLGDDFRYDKTDEWDLQMGNYQKLFDYINSNPELGAEGKFGTLSDYFNAVHEAHPSSDFFPSLTGDFFTYADRDDHYWSGYFTSRPFYKHLDRVLEANLRSAEILFSLALGYARKETASNFPSVDLMRLLVMSRRSLGLFQHHDGITGTAKDFVVNDYGKRLLDGINGAKQVIIESAAFLVSTDKAQYKYNAMAPLLDMDETRSTHDSLPVKPTVRLDATFRPVVLYNSLGYKRTQLVRLKVSHARVEVQDPWGNKVHTQLSFIAEVPALGLAVYSVRQVPSSDDVRNHIATTTFLNSKHAPEMKGDLFPVQTSSSPEDFTIKNTVLEATFAGTTGLLKSVKVLATGKVHAANIQFVMYGVRNTKEKSGAYLFLPDGRGTPIVESNPLIRIMRGPIVSEVQVFFQHVHHIVRLINSPGVDGVSLDIHNIVDIRNQGNKEIAMRINTDIANTDRVFFTDLNGFQMQRRQTLDKLPLQANVYPMPSTFFMQDSKSRFSILSGQALGVHLQQQGQVDVMLDRRLNQDDGRGLVQGVLDNRRTPNNFRVMFEDQEIPPQKLQSAVAYPSLLAHQSLLYLTQPVFTMPRSPKRDADAPKFVPSLAPMRQDLPCEIHLLNLRTMQNKDDNPNLKFIPRESTALLLHHQGSDCSFPLHSVSCRPNDGKVTFSDLFRDLTLKDIHETSLTLMHDHEEVLASAQHLVPPMEIKTFRVTLS
ncbi:hypothetical protein BaRGS_00034701, partial [Batillaria attramentaria]